MINAKTVMDDNTDGTVDSSATVSFVLKSAPRRKLCSIERDEATNTHLLLFVESGQSSLWLENHEYRLFPGRCFLRETNSGISSVNGGRSRILTVNRWIGRR